MSNPGHSKPILKAHGQIKLSMLAVSADISLYRDASHVLALLQLCADYGPAGITAEDVDDVFFDRLRRQTAETILAQGVKDGVLAIDERGRHRLAKYGQDSLAEGKAWVLGDSGLWTLLVVGGGSRSLLCGQEGLVIRQIDGREESRSWCPLESIPHHPEWDALRRLIAAIEAKASVNLYWNKLTQKTLLTPKVDEANGFRWCVRTAWFDVSMSSSGDGWWRIEAMQARPDQPFVSEFNKEASGLKVQGRTLAQLLPLLGIFDQSADGRVRLPAGEFDYDAVDLVNLVTKPLSHDCYGFNLEIGALRLGASSAEQAMGWFAKVAEQWLGSAVVTIPQVMKEIDTYVKAAGIKDHQTTSADAAALLTEFSRCSTKRANASRIGYGLDFP
jgi:hypothetical protein